VVIKSSKEILAIATALILILSMIGTGAAATEQTEITEDLQTDGPEFSESQSKDKSTETNNSSITVYVGSISITIGGGELFSILSSEYVISFLEGLLGDFIVIDEDIGSPINEEDSEDEVDDEDQTGDEDTTDAEDLDLSEVEQYIHEALNEERAGNGVDELSFDTELQDIARAHSEDMAERDYLSHEDSEGNGFTDRYEQAGYECSVNGYVGGENIAQTWYDTPVNTTDRGTVHYENEQELGYGVVEQWMASSGHADNLLAPHWENQGIGVAMTEDNQVYVTQNFC
jgi:uncharacterized protein YkwD